MVGERWLLCLAWLLLTLHSLPLRVEAGFGTNYFYRNFAFTGSSPQVTQLFSNGTCAFVRTQYDSGAITSYSRFQHGIITAHLKLPGGYTAGIVSTFYLTSFGVGNPDSDKTRDEIDFEFLGNVHGRGYVIATNYYANGLGRDKNEEGFYVWFNPTTAYHTYSIQWSKNFVYYWIDGIPIRAIHRKGRAKKPCNSFPCKPMYLSTSIWDGSAWATQGTDGAVIPANYSYAPFTMYAKSIDVTQACRIKKNGSGCTRRNVWDNQLTHRQRKHMYQYRLKYMKYSNVISCGSTGQPKCPRPS